MTRIFFACAFLFVASMADAQVVAVGNENLTWDQPDTSLTSAQGAGYDVKDGTAAATPLMNVTCSGATSPYKCQTRLPALTTGLHSLAVQQRRVVSGQTLLSGFSMPLSLTIVAIPQIPQNVRIE